MQCDESEPSKQHFLRNYSHPDLMFRYHERNHAGMKHLKIRKGIAYYLLLGKDRFRVYETLPFTTHFQISKYSIGLDQAIERVLFPHETEMTFAWPFQAMSLK